MNPRTILTLLAAVALGALAWRSGGWKGMLMLVSGLALWGMLHFTRITTVMRRAADRPIGYVDSAVMVNARLRTRMPLLSVLGITRALGERLSPADADPEVFRWTDPGGSHVTAQFQGGRLAHWTLWRPEPAADAEPGAGGPA